MSGFNNPVVGALNLIRKAIRSPNYAANTSGWSINQDGSAEFNNVSARGTVDVGTPTTPHVIIGTIAFPGGGTAQGMIQFTAPGDPHWSLPGYIAPTAGAGAGTTETGIMALYPPVYDGDPSHGVPNNQVSVNITQAADGPSQLQAGYLSTNKLTTSASGTAINGDLSVTGIRNVQFKQKVADQNLVSQITVQNDTDLSVPLVANATYDVRIYGSCKSPANGIQTAWSVPSGATGTKMCIGPTSVPADGQNRGDTKMRLQGSIALNTVIQYSVDLTVQTVVQETGLVKTGVTAGNLTFQWAQITSSATAATMFAGSYMVVERIG